MPLVQLLVPVHARLVPLQSALVSQVSRPLLSQQTWVAESHALPPHEICPAPPSVPRGGVVMPPPGWLASTSIEASSPPGGGEASSPGRVVASSPPPEASSPPPLLVPPLLPVPPPEADPLPLLPPPELPALVPPSPDAVAPDPLHPTLPPRMIAIEAPSTVRSADIEVPPRTFFTASFLRLTGAQWVGRPERLQKCGLRQGDAGAQARRFGHASRPAGARERAVSADRGVTFRAGEGTVKE
jgi:hypothetical protein